MSSEQVAASLRQKQSSLKTQRSSSVPQLRRSQQETQEIQQFIKTIFTKENLWFIRPEDQKNIVEKAKEVNQKIKKDQALKSANIESEVGKEEPLPLNDPFVGDGSLGGSGSSITVSYTHLTLPTKA